MRIAITAFRLAVLAAAVSAGAMAQTPPSRDASAGEVVMYPGLNQVQGGPWTIDSPVGAPPGLDNSVSSGLQELADFIWDGAAKGLAAHIRGKGGKASNDAFLAVAAQLNFHPLRNQHVTFDNLGLYSALSSGCTLALDSMVEADLDFPGSQIGARPPAGSDTTCAVLIAPHTGNPFERWSGIAASHIRLGALSNATQSGASVATLLIDLSQGGITNGAEISTPEINGAGSGNLATVHYGVLVKNAGSHYTDPGTGPNVSSFSGGAELKIGHIHLFDTAGLQLGRNTTEGASINGAVVSVNGLFPSGEAAKGFSTFGHGGTITAPHISNEQGTMHECGVFEQNATGNIAMIGCKDLSGHGIVNGVRFAPGATGNVVLMTTQGTVTNPVIDNSGGCNLVVLNGKITRSCDAGPTLNGVAPGSVLTKGYTAGDWRPSLAGGTTAGMATYDLNVGSYEQLDRQFTLRFKIVTRALRNPVGTMRILGIPAVPGGVEGSCFVSNMAGVTLDANYTTLTGRLAAGANYIELMETGSGQIGRVIDAKNFAAATTLTGVCHYTD